MPYDEDTQRHFYFGNVFFKQFVGIFDAGNDKFGLALSNLATTGSSLTCPGTSCQEVIVEPVPPEPIPDPIVYPNPPDPVPEPQPQPYYNTSHDSDYDLMWLWLVLGLGLLLTVVGTIAVYYFHRAKSETQFRAAIYAQTPNDLLVGGPGHSGDMI